MLFNVIFSVVMVTLAAIIAMGYGDKLIAGFNRLKPEERERYHVKRLRGVVAVAIVVFTALIVLPDGERWLDEMFIIANSIYCTITMFIAIILAKTWCKKK